MACFRRRRKSSSRIQERMLISTKIIDMIVLRLAKNMSRADSHQGNENFEMKEPL
jgi:hypothetical protein